MRAELGTGSLRCGSRLQYFGHMRAAPVLWIGGMFGLCAVSAVAAKLQEATLAAWETYEKLTEARIERELASEKGFLVRNFLDEREQAQIRDTIRSSVYVKRMTTPNEEGGKIDVPDGLIHHWYGTVLVPGATLDQVLAWVQDYERHEEYFDEVEDSRLDSQSGDTFDIFLRLRRKKVISVYYNTEHEVIYRRHGSDRASSRSKATRIAEIDNAGTDREKEKPVGEDRGFLWRLDSYWRFAQQADGVVVECESISLSRTIPVAFRWVVRPFINSVPRESLEATLLPLRKAFLDGTRSSLRRPDVGERPGPSTAARR